MQNDFSLLNDYYDKIYVLSLPRLSERINYIKHVLDGLKYEFVWGVDKEQMSLDELKASGLYDSDLYRSFYKKPKEMTLGMLCCSLGHVRIYKDILNKGYKKTLVLEDDVVPIKDNLKYFSQIIKELPSDWELLYLGYEKNDNFGWRQQIKQVAYNLIPFHPQLKMEKEFFRHYYPRQVSEHIASAGFHDCTHAYCLTQSGAEKLLKHQEPVVFNADNLLSYLICTNRLKGYICSPKLFNQLSAFSNDKGSLTGN